MRASTLFVLTLCVLVGLGVAIAAKMAGYFNPPPAPVVEVPKKAKEVMVLAANRNLFGGDLIDVTMVYVRPLRAEEADHYQAHKDDYPAPTPASIYLRVASKNILGDQPILKEHMKEMVKPDSLDARLVPQMRAINVAMSKEQAAGGLIQVGDWVDVLLTSTVEIGKDSSATRTACIVPRVRVIAKRNSLWPVFAPLPDDKPVHFTLEVNPYRAALVEFTRNKGMLVLAPLPGSEQRKLEAVRAEMLKNPDAAGAIQFISTDDVEASQEESRVDGILKGHQSVSEADLIRIFGLSTAAPPMAPVDPVTIERISGVYHREPLFFDAAGKYVAVGNKRVDGIPDLRNPASVGGTGIQFTVPDCPTCKEKAKKLSKK
jgi:Flp pilus assembly protein CpaB